MNGTSRTKKVYHLRKTVTSALKKDKAIEQKTEKQETSQFKVDIDGNNNSNNNQPIQNNSFIKKANKELNIQENATFE